MKFVKPKTKTITETLSLALRNYNLSTHLNNIKMLETKIFTAFSNNLKASIKLANYKNKILVLLVPSPAIKYKIQLEKTKVLSILQALPIEINDLKIIVDYDLFEINSQKLAVNTINNHLAKDKQKVANNISISSNSVTNSNLKNALNNLSNTILRLRD